MPKISTSARFFNSDARRAAYISPLASPAESRICVGGIPKKVNRWPAAATAVPKGKQRHRKERKFPVPCIGAGTSDSKSRAAQAILDALPVRAVFPYGTQESCPHA